MRTAPETPGSETPLLLGKLARNAFQREPHLLNLLEAPTPKLIAFIHWYYWTHNVVQSVVMYIAVGWKIIEASLHSIPAQYEAHFIQTSLFFTFVAILGLAAVGSLVLLPQNQSVIYTL